MNFKKIMAAAVASVMAVGTMAVAASAADSYTAAITFQSSSYKFRNTISQANALAWDDEIGEAVKLDATFKDATITGDGEYTVEMSGVEDNGWYMVKLETNIPSADYPDINLVIKSIEIDGAAVDFDAEAAAMGTDNLKSDNYSDWEFNTPQAVRAQIINTYDNLEAISNKGFNSIKVTFEITGMSAAASDDNGAASDDNGSTTTPTDDKQNADTGVEGVAVVAGIAVLAAGAIIVAKKRK